MKTFVYRFGFVFSPSVKFFMWIMAINTMGLVQRRFPTCAAALMCATCCKSGEYIDHLLLHCEFTAQVWSCFRKIFNLQGAMSVSMWLWMDEALMGWPLKDKPRVYGETSLELFRGSFGKKETWGFSLIILFILLVNLCSLQPLVGVLNIELFVITSWLIYNQHNSSNF